MLTRDYAHFALGPHTDSTGKFITALFYLPANDSLAAFGTSIYHPKQSGFTAWKGSHDPHDQFDLIRTFPYLPNTLFLFIKTDNSFHGVEPGEYENTGRNMMMWIPEIGQSTRTFGRLSLPRSLFEHQRTDAA